MYLGCMDNTAQCSHHFVSTTFLPDVEKDESEWMEKIEESEGSKT